MDIAVLGGDCAGCWGDALAHEDGCHGSQEDGVAAEESKESSRGGEDFPLRLESARSLLTLREDVGQLTGTKPQLPMKAASN